MRDPLDSYITWYLALPASHQSDVASFVTEMMPDHPLQATSSDDRAAQFIAWVERSKENPFSSVGLALCLIAITEFIFINQRGSSEDWAVKTNNLHAMQAEVEARGLQRLIARVQESLQQLPENASGWIATAASWRKVRGSGLSEDSLQAWLMRGGN